MSSSSRAFPAATDPVIATRSIPGTQAITLLIFFASFVLLKEAKHLLLRLSMQLEDLSVFISAWIMENDVFFEENNQ
jgi:hypothetical protein